MRSIIAISLAILASACSMEKGSLIAPAPSGDFNIGAPSPVASRPLSYVQGTWTGTETASVGQSGSLSVTFTQSPANDGVVAASITWTSAVTSLTFHGSLTGTLSAMVISASDAPAGGCGYNASGALNEAGTQITGSYTGSGPAPCPTKAGTFVLNGQSYVPPVDVCPNLEGNQSTVPQGYTKNEAGQCVVVPPPNCGTTFYYQMKNGNANSKQNKCENTATPHGIWLGAFNIPGDSPDGGIYQDVCKFTPNPPGNPGNDMALLFSAPNICQ